MNEAGIGEGISVFSRQRAMNIGASAIFRHVRSIRPLPAHAYLRDGFVPITKETTQKLDELVLKIESESVSFKGWATPGATMHAAALDLARTACRRAERRVCAMEATGDLQNDEILVYLNRLSDALWLLARWVEAQTSAAGGEKAASGGFDQENRIHDNNQR